MNLFYDVTSTKRSQIAATTSIYGNNSLDFNVTSSPVNLSRDGIPIVDFSNDPMKMAIDGAMKWLSICILVEVMLGLGCTVDVHVLKEHIKRPIGVGIAALSQFVIMPLIVFGLVKVMTVPHVPSVVMLVTVSVPGGTLSNILAYFVEGDMALSMLMTTFSSILAFAFIPFNLFVYGSQWLPEDTDYKHLIPYPSVVMSLMLMLVPVSVGVIVKWKLPNVAEKIVTVCKVLLLATIICLAILSGLLYGDSLLRYLPNELWIMCVVMPIFGFTLGYLFSTLARLSDQSRRTVAVETMCQNGQLGCAILKIAFPNNLIGSFFIFPLLYSVFQLVEGSIFVALVRCTKRDDDEKASEEDFFKIGAQPVRAMRRVSLHVIDKVKKKFSRSKSDDDIPVFESSSSVDDDSNGVIMTSLKEDVAAESFDEAKNAVTSSSGDADVTHAKDDVAVKEDDDVKRENLENILENEFETIDINSE